MNVYELLSLFRASNGIAKELIFAVIAVVLFFLGELVMLATIRVVERIVRKTKTTLDDEIVREIKKKGKLLIIVLSLFISAYAVYGNLLLFGRTLYDWFLIALLLTLGFSIIRIADLFVIFYSTQIAPKMNLHLDKEMTHLFRNIVKYSLYALLILMLLSLLGIDITPLIAGLGIAGLAVGLALQDTLSNFFAGLYLLIDRPISIGDYVKIGDVEGVVSDIGWRSTKLVTWNNILIVLPNSKVANSTVTNYLKPTSPIVHVVKFGVEYGSDIDKVIEIAKEIGEEMTKEGILSDVKPFWVRFDDIGESSLNFKAGICVNDYRKRYSAQAEFLRRLYLKLVEHGIGIPYPTRTIYLKSLENSKSNAKQGKAKKQSKRRKKKNNR